MKLEKKASPLQNFASTLEPKNKLEPQKLQQLKGGSGGETPPPPPPPPFIITIDVVNP